MVNFPQPRGEVCLFSNTVQDSCLVLDGQMAATHIHTDFEDFPHAVLVTHITASFWLLAGWSNPLASSITAPTLVVQRTVLY